MMAAWKPRDRGRLPAECRAIRVPRPRGQSSRIVRASRRERLVREWSPGGRRPGHYVTGGRRIRSVASTARAALAVVRTPDAAGLAATGLLGDGYGGRAGAAG